TAPLNWQRSFLMASAPPPPIAEVKLSPKATHCNGWPWQEGRRCGTIPCMGTIFSFLYWVYLGSTSILLFVGAVVIWAFTTPFDPAGALLHRYSCWWARLYLRCLPGCRLRVEGREKIIPGTPYVMVANHQSLTDVMALSALRVLFKWVSKKE